MPAAVFQSVSFVVSVADLHQLPPDTGAEVAFAGRSNAGKSSAINAICGRRKLAFVSRTPGRTQLINYFRVGPAAHLVDLPGYGYARVPGAVRAGWEHLLGGYLRTRRALRGVVLIMDARHPLTPLDLQLLEWLSPSGCPVLILLTKADKLTRQAAQRQQADTIEALAPLHPGVQTRLFSSVDGTGVEQARAVLLQWLGFDESKNDRPRRERPVGGRQNGGKISGPEDSARMPAAEKKDPRSKGRNRGPKPQ